MEGPQDRRSVLAIAGLAALALVWGTQFLVIKTGQATMPALLASTLRFAVLAFAAQIATTVVGARAPAGTLAPRVAFGVTQAMCFGAIYWAEKHLASSLVGLLSSTAPLFVALLAHRFVPGERLRARTALALLFGFVGATVLVGSARLDAGSVGLVAAAAIVVGEVAGAANKVLGKHLVARVPAPVLLRDMGATVAALNLGAWLLFERDAPRDLNAKAIGAFLYLGLVASFAASGLYLVLLRRFPVSKLAYLQFVTPLVAALTGVALGGERLAASQVLGAAAILVGLGVLAIRPSRSA